MRRLTILLFAASLAVPAAGARTQVGGITVLAAASLTSIFPMIDRGPRYSFGGSDTLAAQIRQGAPADVFAAANTTLPNQLYTQGLVDSLPRLGSRAALGRTRLQEIAGVVPAIADFPDGCRFNPRCARATDICRTTAPETTLLGAGGLVRCHHHA